MRRKPNAVEGPGVLALQIVEESALREGHEFTRAAKTSKMRGASASEVALEDSLVLCLQGPEARCNTGPLGHRPISGPLRAPYFVELAATIVTFVVADLSGTAIAVIAISGTSGTV